MPQLNNMLLLWLLNISYVVELLFLTRIQSVFTRKKFKRLDLLRTKTSKS